MQDYVYVRNVIKLCFFSPPRVKMMLDSLSITATVVNSLDFLPAQKVHVQRWA